VGSARSGVRQTGNDIHKPFVGSATEIAADIRQYEALGVKYLVLDFARLSRSLDEMLQRLEAFATRVWPQV
jgi:hypothetical protein